MSTAILPPGSGRCLHGLPPVSDDVQRRVLRDYERFADGGAPSQLEEYLAEEYGVDVSAEYAGMRLKNPWGKASGQLSMNLNQVREDLDASLGFIVLKTVIAEDERGDQSMQAWAIREARMVVEPITAPTGDTGWTVTWKGRGWWQSFDAYLDLVRQARELASGTGTLIVPSVKYHLPAPDEDRWRVEEYRFTTQRLIEAWSDGLKFEPMPIEKDFSPTLAGSDRSAAKARILDWLREIPPLIRSAALEIKADVRVGQKIFNAVFDDEFQLEMLRVLHTATAEQRSDFFIYANRLFDPQREFDGVRGVAYGGPELSDRNLRVMSAFESLAREQGWTRLPWSATGNISSGRMACEYELRGASSFQLHTFFQLPTDCYRMKQGTRTQRALHELYFHPIDGYVLWKLARMPIN